VSRHHVPSRSHLQGRSAPIRLRHRARDLTDGLGLLVIHRLWDEVELGDWTDGRSDDETGRFCSSLMV